MNGVFGKAALWTALGVAIGIILNPQVAGLLNPILANLKISVAMQTS
jgi:hypothetical protein